MPRLGNKAYEQCAGFLRIQEGREPLDASAVHPERYDLVRTMAKDHNCAVADLIGNEHTASSIKMSNYCTVEIGEPTLRDIISELSKPGRDPRPTFKNQSFADVHSIDDLSEDMVLPGIITNVTSFGAFVDIGVHQDGLVHISQIADRFISDPSEEVQVRQQVSVRVLEIDTKRKRISLSMKGLNQS